MAIVDTHCHASPYWYAPVESLLDEMNRSRVDKAVLIQIGGIYDNSYHIRMYAPLSRTVFSGGNG
jgi:L-fuconolactonase